MNRYKAIILNCVTIITILSFTNSIHGTSTLSREAEAEIRHEVFSTNTQNVYTDRKETPAKATKVFQVLSPIHKSQTYRSPALVSKRHVWTQAFLL